MVAIAQHSKVTVEHGTPGWLLELERRVLGGSIEWDPCSSAYWQEHVVRAELWSPTLADDVDGWPVGARAHVNPPGGLVREVWRASAEHWRRGGSVFWVGFNLGQMPYLQDDGFMFPGFRRAMPRKRVAYMARPRDVHASLREQAERVREKHGECRRWARLHEQMNKLEQAGLDGPAQQSDAPPHHSYLCLLPSSLDQVERFDVEMRALGAEVF